MWGILIAIIAAMAYSLGGVLQHRAISSSPTGGFDGRGLATGARKPLWLVGLVVMGVGVGIQLVALSMTELVVVQTIMVSMMVWVLVFAVLFEQVRIGRAEITGSGVATAAIIGLAVVLAVAALMAMLIGIAHLSRSRVISDQFAGA